MKKALIALLCLNGFFSLSAQVIENVISTLDGDRLVIRYDLTAADTNQKFKVSLFSSHDNYTAPLTLLQGDAGDNILPGKNHIVTWDVKKSVPTDFDGEIRIKVKASRIVTEVISKLSLLPLLNESYKRGSTLELKWTGGSTGDKVAIELLNGGVVVQKIAEETNSTRAYSWSLAKDIKPGKDYSIRVTDLSKAQQSGLSNNFAIKPKVSMVFKAGALVVVGTVVYFIAGSSSGKDPATVSDLPGPVKP